MRVLKEKSHIECSACKTIQEIHLQLKNWNLLPFYKRNPLKIFPPSNLREKPLKIEKLKSTSILQEKSLKKCYAFNFIWKNPLKFIELTFNFKGKSLYFLLKKNQPWNSSSNLQGNLLTKFFWRKIPVKLIHFSEKSWILLKKSL